MKRFLLLLHFLTAAITAVTTHGAEPLTTTAAIRALSPEQARLGPPARLEAVVTFYHEDWGVLLIHDGHNGICVGVPHDKRPAQPYLKGERLRIEGTVSEGEFLPVVLPDQIVQLGPGTPPVYEKMSAEALFAPALDCHPVEVTAVVKGTSFQEQSLVVDLQIDGWQVRALVPQSRELRQIPWQLLERRVRVHGVAGTHFNDQRQMSGRLLFVPDLESFQIVEEPQASDTPPLATVSDLLRVHTDLRTHVRLRGQCTHLVPGRGLYLRGEGGSMFIQTAQPLQVQRGDGVEVDGYPLITHFRPSLSARDVRQLTGADTIRSALIPQPFDPSAQRNSREQCELVTLDAEFIEVIRGRESTALICRAAGQVFEAHLSLPEIIPEDYAPGTTLRLTGICELISDRPLVIPRNATGFRILLRQPADILVLARPSWWNEQHALWVLGIVGLLALMIAAWALALQFIVRRQSRMIRQHAEKQGTMEERQRIARDLHDTLEQELVGVNMLLDSTSMKMNGEKPAEATETLDLARRLLRRAREDSRSTIRELRSVTLEQRGLSAAIEELLKPLATAAGARFTVQTIGLPARLPGTMELNLLRLAQEAVSNAGKHSGAKNIDLRLQYTDSQVLLEVHDDGHGFDLHTLGADGGHFGLSGMRERAEKINGQLRLQSEPGMGTTVSVTAPRQPRSGL
ncbi:MAG: sensor histidine kinase [Verrucomicrobiaceae bacterium]|nr:sensor histidine kinase [Verrucomicrobiaceae bacterium]